MKRDLDLIRDLLLYIEASETYPVHSYDIEIPEADESQILFHIELLIDADYIEALNSSTIGRRSYYIYRLTMSGCDYLDSVRDEQIWKDTASKIISAAGSATLEIVKSVAQTIIMSKLGL